MLRIRSRASTTTSLASMVHLPSLRYDGAARLPQIDPLCFRASPQPSEHKPSLAMLQIISNPPQVGILGWAGWSRGQWSPRERSRMCRVLCTPPVTDITQALRYNDASLAAGGDGHVITARTSTLHRGRLPRPG